MADRIVIAVRDVAASDEIAQRLNERGLPAVRQPAGSRAANMNGTTRTGPFNQVWRPEEVIVVLRDLEPPIIDPLFESLADYQRRAALYVNGRKWDIARGREALRSESYR